MDEYFTELMLDQFKRGNKTHKTFTKQAWKDMLTSFNAKFCSQYGNNFLKRRFLKLFKYYTDVRDIIKRKGFYWDEKTRMVVADDVVWDKYIKAHPDKCSYRKKTLPSYQDLDLIYGNDVIDGHRAQRCGGKIFEHDMLKVDAAEVKNRHFCVGPCWTPATDCYLIDLLQDQTLRGNKIGEKFTTEAWSEMIKMFNVKFGSEYDKDILETRYKHLKRQYSDVKFLLEQSGFYWDKSQEKVIAEDYVWDSYSKVHPDFQSYRNKGVPSYHKLCIIFGEESSNARYSLGAQNVLDSEAQVLMIGKDIQFHANGDFAKTDWTPPMDRYLLDLMLDQVRRGNKMDHSLDNQAWIDMAVLFKDRYGEQHIKDILKRRFKSLEKLFSEMKHLLGQRGVSWDETRQLVQVYHDGWEVYIKEHPDARLYRTKPKPSYNDLCLIYGSNERDNRAGQGAKVNHGYCGKNDWTPSMDRFFIDLMLNHVRQGSMVEQRFNELAWRDIVAKFSAAFGSQHDKGILNRRFMNLRKLFIGMKSLLDQNGFAWDDMQQMIIAHTDLWNAYLKEYPEVQFYRSRALPNYNDLFLIYGDVNINGRRYCSSSFMAAEDHFFGPDIAEECGPLDCDPIWINWTKPMEVYFIELMLEQVLKGNKSGDTFSNQAWAWIIAAFNKKFGVLCDRDDVESWYRSLMKEYRNITNLLCRNGFAWDDIQQMVIACGDVWAAYIKEHPGAIKYKERILESYVNLCVIYGDTVPARRLSHLGARMEISDNGKELDDDHVLQDEVYPPGQLETYGKRKKRKHLTSSSVPSGKCQRLKEEGGEVFGLKSLKGNTSGGEEEKHMSIEVIVDALQTIPGMDDELFLEACKLLENDVKAKGFVAMDVNQRRNWLYRKLRR